MYNPTVRFQTKSECEVFWLEFFNNLDLKIELAPLTDFPTDDKIVDFFFLIGYST